MKYFVMLIFGIFIGAFAMYFYCCSSESELIAPPSKGLISPDQAKALDQAYNERYRLISDSLVKREGGDNRSSWYGVTEVRGYLNYAENEAKELGYIMDGVRIYLGAHPDENGEAGYTTMFLVPTGKSNKVTASTFNFSMRLGGDDIPGARGLDFGGRGDPPGANYTK